MHVDQSCCTRACLSELYVLKYPPTNDDETNGSPIFRPLSTMFVVCNAHNFVSLFLVILSPHDNIALVK